MDGVHERRAAKTKVTLSLDEDILRQAQALPGNLSERVEKLLATDIVTAQRERTDRDARLDATIAAWNAFDEKHGSFADQFVDDIL